MLFSYWLHYSIPANFFWYKGVRFSSGYCGITGFISKNALKLSENLRRQSERFWRSYNHLRKSVPGYHLPSTTSSLSKNGESSVEELSFTSLFNPLLLWVQITHLHIFQGFVKYGCNNSYFPVRHEKLVCRRDWMWDRSFWLTGVRPTSKAWQLAGILLTIYSVVECEKHCQQNGGCCLAFVFSAFSVCKEDVAKLVTFRGTSYTICFWFHCVTS